MKWLVLVIGMWGCDDGSTFSPFFGVTEMGTPAPRTDAGGGAGEGGTFDRGPAADRGAADRGAADATRPPGDLGRPPADARVQPDGRVPVDMADPPDPVDSGGMNLPCLVALVQLNGYEIFAHEASRPDATFDGEGQAVGGACSRPGVRPWVNLTQGEAEAACAASGFHLCSDAEWQDACGGADRHWAFPYAAEHHPGTCNDHVSGTGALQPTGTLVDCHSPEGAYDMSGNVWEMTSDGSRRGASWRVNAVMFRTEAARCDITYVNSEAFYADDVGYRCCRTLQ